MRMGGEFELYPASFRAPQPGDAPWPAPDMPHGLWVDLGRSALFLAAKAAQARGCKHVHIPAYCCHSVIEPMEKAGLNIVLYGGVPFGPIQPPNLSADDAFLFIQYFGAACIHGQEAALAAREQGAFIIEDRVQAGLMNGVPVLGDMVVTSLRKLIGAPDGAFLGSRLPIDTALLPPDERLISLRVTGKILRGAGTDAGQFLPLLDGAEEALEADAPRTPSHASAMIISATDFTEVEAKRRSNWQALDVALTPLVADGRLTKIMPELKPGEVPLGYPVLLASPQMRNTLRNHLRDREIFCPVHWPLDHLDRHSSSFPAERLFQSTMLTLPIDQRYEAAKIHHLSECIVEFFRITV